MSDENVGAYLDRALAKRQTNNTVSNYIDKTVSKTADKSARLLEKSLEKRQKVATRAKASGTINFDSAVEGVFAIEGGYVADDASDGATNFGINQEANPDIDVKNLTRDQAKGLYKERYWDQIGADNLPDNIKAMAFDTAVNQGPGTAMKMLEQARTDNGYDLNTFIDLRKQRYAQTLNSSEYQQFSEEQKQQYATSWDKRINDIGLMAKIPEDTLAPLNKAADKAQKLEAKGKISDREAFKSYIQREAYIPSRDTGEVIGDAAAALGVGVVQVADTAYGLTNIASGGVPDAVFKTLDPEGKKYSQRSQQLKESIKEAFYSDKIQAQEQRRGAQASFRQESNENKYNNELAKFAANFGGAVSEYAVAPGLAANTAVESLPQMFVPGGLARAGVSKFAATTLSKNVARQGTHNLAKYNGKRMTEAYLSSKAGKAAIGRIQERTGLSYIAASEGISNGMEVQAEILNASEEDLRASSSEYVKARLSGESHQEAKEALADKAGLVTTGIAGLFGLISAKGTGAGKFEGRLFKMDSPLGKSITAKVSNKALLKPSAAAAGGALREGVEETLQGGGGTLAGNFAKSITSNDDQELLEGVADAAGQGLVIGALSGGGLAGGASVLEATGSGVVEGAKLAAAGIQKTDAGSKLRKAAETVKNTGEAVVNKVDDVVQAKKDVTRGERAQ